MRNWVAVIAALAICVLASGISAEGRTPGDIRTSSDDGFGGKGPLKHPKIDAALLQGPLPSSLDPSYAKTTVIDLAIVASDVTEATGTLRRLGGSVTATYGDRMQARVPAGALVALADSPHVARLEQTERLDTMAVSSEGVVTASAKAWHSAGVNGTGVKVAIIDGGFEGYQRSQQLGDLPASLVTADFCGGLTSGGRHGTAVAEIVHDMAPAASLYLICADTAIGLGAAKDYAKAQGVKVINMSGGYYNHSRGDGRGGPGTPDAIVADARASGILWVNSAGNAGRSHWGGAFSSPDGDGWHNFTPTDEGNSVTVRFGERLCAFLKWDEWPLASSDFDLLLFRSSDQLEVARSVRQGLTAPTEALCFINFGATQEFFVGIFRFAGLTSPRLDLFLAAGAMLEYQTAQGSIVDPAASPAVLAVGAVCWQGNLLGLFSSQGPTIDGRTKPDLAGPTQVTSAAYGPAAGCDVQSGFGGTSGSSPHVAGAAALVLQANPTFTPAQVQAYLEQRATDLGPPGKDNFFGAGVLSLGVAPAPVAAAAPVIAPPPTFTVYLPNIVRMLGGRYGWHTPFIVQNVGTASTSLSVKYYTFSDGSLVATRTATVLPGRSFVGSPNDEGDLPADTQFSVVITSVGSPVVAVVNEHQGGPDITAEALSYSGFSTGSTKVSLPLVSKLSGGWLTTMIIQNLGAATTTVTGTFVRLDLSGSPGLGPPPPPAAPPVVLTRVVQPGRSQFIDPRSEATLASGAEYAATFTSAEPIGVVANAHNDLPGTVAPRGDSYNGVPAVTATTTYVPYIANNTDGIGRSSDVYVQNVGTTPAMPTVTRQPFGGGGATTTSVAPTIPPGASWSFSNRATLGQGEYSLTVSGGTFAVLATATSTATAMFYTGSSTPAQKLFMPNVTRSLSGGPGDPGWTTPILIQSAGATAATLKWYRFSDGSLVTTQNLVLPPGATTRVDPRTVSGLTDNTQYSVALESPGQVVAIVTELNLSAGDNAMVYRAFAGEASVVLRTLLFDGAVPDTEADEYVEFQNVGTAAQDMTGWKIVSARAAQTFTFGALTLQPGQTCRLYTNESHPAWCSLSWTASSAIWNNAGDRANLVNALGKTVSSIGYGGY